MTHSFPDRIVLCDYGRLLARQIELLEASSVLPANKETAMQFINFCKADPQICDGTLVRYTESLRKILRCADKPFRDMTESDMTALLVRLKEMRMKTGRAYAPRSQ